MTFPASNSLTDDEESQVLEDSSPTSRQHIANGHDLGAMKNFSYEASAAQATDLYEGAFAENRTKAKERRSLFDLVEPTFEQHEDEQLSPFRIVIKPEKKGRRGLPSWLVSLSMHLVLIVVGLLSLTLASQKKQDVLDWTPSAIAYEEIETMQDVEIDPIEAFESLDEGLASGAMTASFEIPTDDSKGHSVKALIENVVGDGVGVASGLDDLGQLLGDGQGLSSLGEGPGAGATAKFFGTEVEGNRILYMLDNSGGMKKGKV